MFTFLSLIEKSDSDCVRLVCNFDVPVSFLQLVWFRPVYLVIMRTSLAGSHFCRYVEVWLRSHALSSLRVLPFTLFATLPFFTSWRFFHSINRTNSSTIAMIERTTQIKTDPLSLTCLSAALLENRICLRCEAPIPRSRPSSRKSSRVYVRLPALYSARRSL
jgi:hypothetical protein